MITILIKIMDSSQVFLAKSILQALIKDTDLENTFHGKVFVRFVWDELPAGLANYAISLLACQQLLHQIHHHQEETTRFGMVMQIYNLLSQQEEDEMDRKFTEAVDTLEIVLENNNVIEGINFGMDSGYLSE